MTDEYQIDICKSKFETEKRGLQAAKNRFFGFEKLRVTRFFGFGKNRVGNPGEDVTNRI